MEQSSLPSMVRFSHHFAADLLRPGDLAVDATAGNGHDTVFLARAVGESGRVFSFDVQEKAIVATRAAADRAGLLPRIVLFYCGHEHLEEKLAPFRGRLKVVMFNLGYLPGSDKSIITRPGTTIAGLRAAFDLLAPGGRILIVAYPGHPGGAEDARAVRGWVENLPPDAAEIFKCECLTPTRRAPFLTVVDRRLTQDSSDRRR